MFFAPKKNNMHGSLRKTSLEISRHFKTIIVEGHFCVDVLVVLSVSGVSQDMLKKEIMTKACVHRKLLSSRNFGLCDIIIQKTCPGIEDTS